MQRALTGNDFATAGARGTPAATPTLVAVIGDRVEILIDIGGGVQAFEIEATRAGRRVEVSSGRGIVEVTELTRTGQPVRTGRFMSNRVVAIVEHPAGGRDDEGERPTPSRRDLPERPPDLWSAADS
jgi:hypothetical protein